MSLPGRLGRLERAGTIVLLAAAAWYWLRFFHRSTNLLDEGSTAWQALRVFNGELIYRDFFTVVTPLSYYTVALLYAVFGTSLMVLRWAAFAAGLGVLLVTFFVTRRVAPWPFAAGAALMTTVFGWFLVTPNFYSLQASLFSMLALAAYVHGSPAPRWLLLSGAAVGMTAMTKQNVGAYTAVALLLTIWLSRLFDDRHDVRGRIKMTAQFVAGICVPVVPTVIFLIASGAGPYLYESWIYYPLTKYPPRFALPYPEFAPVLQMLPAVMMGRVSEPAVYDYWVGLVVHLPTITYPLALISIAVLAYRYQRTRDPRPKHEGHALLAITLTAMFTLLQAWPRADIPHILFALPPTYALFAYLLARLVPDTNRAEQWLVPDTNHGRAGWSRGGGGGAARSVARGIARGVALAPMLVLLWYGYQRTNWEYQNYVAGLHVERGRGIVTQYLEAQRIDVVTTYLVDHTTPDEPIFVVPWASGFYFLANRNNPTRTDFLLFEDPELYPCLIARLDARPPKYVVYGYTWDVDGKRFSEYAAPVDRYIRSRYAIEFTTDGYEIWRRRDDAPQAAGTFPRACQPRRFRINDWF
ncbi:MAG TPA: glycosyltransferase family 39 protein [Vicinamibacterales bacterium]|nr:glycosyltransferase family 39 protein [Vicinamibacterales bacterium]